MRPFASSELREVGGPATVGNARRAWSARQSIIVELRDGDRRGVGECAPLPGHSQLSLGAAATELSDLLARPDTLDASLEDASSEARFAIETALLDLAAQRENTSVAALLCGGPARTVEASELLGDPREGRAPTLRVVKLKVGPGPAWDEQLDAIDALVSNHQLVLRLDFNGTLDEAEAPRVLADIAGRAESGTWNVDFVEDPVTTGFERLQTPIDIAIDRMLVTPEGRDRAVLLAAAGHAQVAVLKPALLGGARATIALAIRLHAAGLEPVVSHLLDGPTALAACAELACAIATLTSTVRAAGVGPHPGLAAYGVSPILQLRHGMLHPRVGGLGAAP